MLFKRGTEYSPVGPNNKFKEARRDVSSGKGSQTIQALQTCKKDFVEFVSPVTL
jgi:hypothetical protein